MNRLVRGTVLLAAAVFIWSCGGDPTADRAEGVDSVFASPASIIVSNVDSQAVIVTAVNELGQVNDASFSLGNAGAGLIVYQDMTYLPISNGGNLRTAARFIVKGATSTTFVSSSFTVNASGHSRVIPVKIAPRNLDLPFPNPTPALGDTVVLAAPANTHFTAGTTLSFKNDGTKVAVIAFLSAGLDIIKFLPGPGVGVKEVIVHGLTVDYLPGILFDSVETTGTLTTPAVNDITASLSKATPNVGDTITVTVSAPFRILPTGTLTFGGKPVIELSRTPDSLSVTFIPYPGASGATAVQINGAILSFLPAVPLNLPTSATMTLATELAGTGSFGSAPTITIPATGLTSTIVDAGGFTADPVCTGDLGGPCRLYTFTLAAPRTFQVTATWQGTTDLGIYWYDAGQNIQFIFGCDSKGAGAGGQPETCNVTLGAGTWFLVNDTFSAFYNPPNNVDPTFVRINIVGQ